MILHAGYEAWEFSWWYQRGHDEPEPLRFHSRREALEWLQTLRAQRPEVIQAARGLLARRPPVRGYRRHAYAELDELARRLLAGTIVVVCRERPRQPSIVPARGQKEEFVPFPLSDRKPRASETSYSPPPSDPPTFSPQADLSAQAATLVAAAQEGKPFCPE